MLAKKIINHGNHAVDEMLDGIIAAHPRFLRRADGNPRSSAALDGPRPGKVGLVIGGGSGHEPTFPGFVGKGLADAAAIGAERLGDRSLGHMDPGATSAVSIIAAMRPSLID